MIYDDSGVVIYAARNIFMHTALLEAIDWETGMYYFPQSVTHAKDYINVLFLCLPKGPPPFLT